MSVYTVTRDDFRNARRSYVVLGVIGTFAALVTLVFASEIDIYDHAYRTLFDVSALIGFAFPLFVAPLTYLAIAGDRASGTIKFALGLPNSRFAYFLGKYISRASVAVAAILLGVFAGYVVAATSFAEGADPVRFLLFAGVSSLYALAVTGLFLGISASFTGRSRAMFAVIGAYFVLVPFWYGFLPVVSLGTIVDTVTAALGVELSQSAEELIVMFSPGTAYLQATEVVYSGVIDQHEVFQMNFRPDRDNLARQPWFCVLVLGAWATVAPLLGYLRFHRSELG